ncbi:hypothetical protein FJZ53_04445 [Candidatus Woesearchaeota archaeon]|nr:hypothetical protein [Candidatus Woesearchaeota archaeon]
MADQDFSRIGEIFYKEVGDEADISLEGFIKKALTTYSEKFMAKEFLETIKPKKITFPSSKGYLSFNVQPYYGKPDISSLELITRRYDAAGMLSRLRGDVTAEFLSLDINTADKELKKKVLKAKKNNASQVSGADFYFSLDPETPNIIKRIVWNRAEQATFDKEVFYRGKEDDSGITSLILKANRISVNYSFYIEDNPTMGLIKECCDMKQPSKEYYKILYSISSADEKVLPARILNHLKQVFEIAKDDFDHLSYQRAKIEDVNTVFTGDLR